MYGSLDDKTVSRLVTDMPQMRTLSLARNSALSKITAMAIAKFCTNICHLDFSGTKIKGRQAHLVEYRRETCV